MPIAISSYPPIKQKYDAIGGAAVLGAPTAAEFLLETTETFTGGHTNPAKPWVQIYGSYTRTVVLGRAQLFEKGSIWAITATGTFAVLGPINARWAALGYQKGLGFPTGDTKKVGDGQASAFEGGVLSMRNDKAPVVLVSMPILGEWTATGGAPGFLGFPTDEQKHSALSGGIVQVFEHGEINSHPMFGVHETHGPILDKWKALGGVTGSVGFPLTDVLVVATPPKAKKSADRFVEFHGGVIWSSAETGAISLPPATTIPASDVLGQINSGVTTLLAKVQHSLPADIQQNVTGIHLDSPVTFRMGSDPLAIDGGESTSSSTVSYLEPTGTEGRRAYTLQTNLHFDISGGPDITVFLEFDLLLVALQGGIGAQFVRSNFTQDIPWPTSCAISDEAFREVLWKQLQALQDPPFIVASRDSLSKTLKGADLEILALKIRRNGAMDVFVGAND